MAHDVFVSHSVKDKAVAEEIVASLEANGIQCWVAPRDIVPGADWGESIIDALEASRIMVLVFSANANSSSQIKREVERAVDKEVYTIPFRIDNTEPTRSLEYFISTSQWIDAFPPPLEKHLDKLSRTVKAILARGAIAPPELTKPSEAARPSRFEALPPVVANKIPAWALPAGIVAALAIIGTLLFLLFSRTGSNAGKELHEETAAASEAPAPEATGAPDVSTADSSPASTTMEAAPADTPAADEAANNNLNQTEGNVSATEESSAEPTAVVLRYYESINRRDLARAYGCLSDGFKARRPMDQFSKTFASTHAIDVRRLEEASRDSSSAALSIAFTETDADGRPQAWEGKTFLLKQGGAWRIDATQIKRTQPGKGD